jgi:hypothetical protein
MALTKKGMFITTCALMLSSQVFGHLPSIYDGTLQNGRIGFGAQSNSRAAGTYSNKGEWDPNVVYRGDYTVAQGDTVSYGEFNGKKLWWWAKFYAQGSQLTPGNFAPEGGTSPWVLINSLSATETGTISYKWKGWNGDLENMTGLKAEIPTWRDGAEGAYSFTHDDIGAMPFDLSVKPLWDLSKDYPDIKTNWGVFVEEMDETEWASAIAMVAEGHEMFNHSMKHTSAADQWQWFYPGQTIPSHDPAIPAELRGLKVVGVWGDPEKQQVWPFNYNPITLGKEDPNSIVYIKCTPYWTQNAPSSEPEGTKIKDDNGNILATVMKPVITPKAGVTTITLKTGQKQYVKYTKQDLDSSDGVVNEGTIAATGITWYEPAQLDEYGEGIWTSHSPNVQGDQGAPAFCAKIWCVKAWTGSEYKLNIKDANDLINTNLYSKIISAGEYFPKGKNSEYFGYPFDAYSEVTHDSLEQNGFVGARGGAKSGTPIPGDFFHPYRIDFDAFYITRSDWTPDSKGTGFTYPDNPHVMLGLNEMVDKIVDSKGYMIREFHAVPDLADDAWSSSEASELWPVNQADVGGWWGGITKNQLKVHYDYLQKQIDAHKITVYTVSEVTKYRMTANATSAATITQDGANYNLSCTTEDILPKYQDEISVIVSLNAAVDSLGVDYIDQAKAGEQSPRRKPVKMDAAGKIWSVSVNPFKGDVKLIPNGVWNGQKVVIDNGSSVNKTTNKAVKVGVISNGNSLKVSAPAGSYKIEIYDIRGRVVKSINYSSTANNFTVGYDKMSTGIYVVKLRGNSINYSAKISVK